MTYDFDKVVDRGSSYSLKWGLEPDSIPMWVADMDFECCPDIVRAIQERADQGVFGYTLVPEAWKANVAGWWKNHHGLDIDPATISFASGVIPVINACINAFGKGGMVGVFAPGYNVFESCIRNAGHSVCDVPLAYDGTSYSIDFQAFEAAVSREDLHVFLLCNPHNPTGSIWSSEDLTRIGDLCEKHEVVVVSDEIHCDIVTPGCHHTPFMAVSQACAEVSVMCGAPSKAFNIAGLQSAYLFSQNPELLQAVNNELAVTGQSAPNAFAIQAAMAAYSECDEWLSQMNAYVAGTKQLVSDFFEQNPQMGMKLVPSDSTYLCWIDCTGLLRAKGKKSTHPYQKLLLQNYKVFVYPGMIYGAGGKAFLRMNVATRRSLVEEALDRMRSACKEWLGK